ncbi:MAG: DUF350 domain-containing protein [Candidatus Bathyarchaeota archaeon]|nr:DUF350 domain-containing protein [Candidatus Bathyarchaeota archaeon]
MGLASIGLAFLRLVLSISFAVIGLYVASWVLGKLTKGVNEWEEVSKGNNAVAIYMAGIFLSVAIIMGPGILGLFRTMEIVGLALGFVQLIFALILAVAAQYIGLSVLSKLMQNVDAWEELRNRNIATAIVMAATVVAVGTIVATGVQSIIEVIFV